MCLAPPVRVRRKGLHVDLRSNEVERQLWATLRPYLFGVTSFIPCCSNNETCSAVNLNPWPSGIRSADTGYFGRRGSMPVMRNCSRPVLNWRP